MRFFILGAFLLAVLSGCGEASRSYSLTPPATPGGRLCTNQCVEAQDYCHQSCDLSQRQCAVDVQGRAMHDYDKYTKEQFAAHEPIDLRPRDFERMTPCTDAKKSCGDNCDSNYRLCYGTCGGGVSTTSSYTLSGWNRLCAIF